ncbi:MAG: hypothetical protein QM831_42885 [Kofleriaceae bacterium]
MGDYEIVGERVLLHPKDLTGLTLSPYVASLLLELGPGIIFDQIELLDPRTDRFAMIQQRLALACGPLRSHRPEYWKELEPGGVVFALHHDGDIFVDASSDRIVRLAADGKSSVLKPGDGFPTTRYAHKPYAFSAMPDKASFLAALRAADEAAADAALAAIVPSQSAWVLFELAHDIAFDSELHAELRARYFAECARFAKRFSEAEVPVREIQKDLADGALSPVNAALVRKLGSPQSPVSGPVDPKESELVREILAAPDARDQLIVLADYLEEHQQPLRAQLVREASTGKREGEGSASERVATWRALWAEKSPDLDLAPFDKMIAAIPKLDEYVAALGTWSEGIDPGPLVTDPNAFALLIFALRHERKYWEPEYANSAIELLALHPNAAARPWLLELVRHPVAWDHNTEYRFARAAELVGKLTKAELEEVIGWVEADYFPAVAMALLVKHHKDPRVLDLALDRFFSGHPYSEKIVSKFKTDPKVLPALREKFDQQHKACMINNGRNVRYTAKYKIIAKFLAKLGDADAKAGWDRVKRMRLVDEAAANREMRREGI